ncbi:MAG: hypothetical protein HHAS10_06890 [Candidatus Altimarinota bacterium]
MKKIILLALFLIPLSVFACMPPFPGEVMVGRISSLDQTQSGKVNIGFSSYDFPFRDYVYENPTSWYWQSYSNTSYPGFGGGDLIVALSDYQDGLYPTNYSIFHITTLSCEDNVIRLGKKYGTVMGWDRKNGRCGYEARSLLDVFIEGDESVWIKKLQQKYPTCNDLLKAFPIVQEAFPDNRNIRFSKNEIIYFTRFPWFDQMLSIMDIFLEAF